LLGSASEEGGVETGGKSWWLWSDVGSDGRPSRALHYSGWEPSLELLVAAIKEHRYVRMFGTLVPRGKGDLANLIPHFSRSHDLVIYKVIPPHPNKNAWGPSVGASPLSTHAWGSFASGWAHHHWVKPWPVPTIREPHKAMSPSL
jgi:hypothetical protein